MEKTPAHPVKSGSNLNSAVPFCRGYFSVAKDFLSENDFEFIYDSIRLIAYELGVRFFSDYLEGNVYFKVKDREQNLRRALVQFRLVESIESQDGDLRAVIRDAK